MSTNRSLEQWVFLRIHIDISMTRMTCGTAGGAISLWIKLGDCPRNAGIVSTIDNGAHTGFRIFCYGASAMTYVVYLDISHLQSYFNLHEVRFNWSPEYSEKLKITDKVELRFVLSFSIFSSIWDEKIILVKSRWIFNNLILVNMYSNYRELCSVIIGVVIFAAYYILEEP